MDEDRAVSRGIRKIIAPLEDWVVDLLRLSEADSPDEVAFNAIIAAHASLAERVRDFETHGSTRPDEDRDAARTRYYSEVLPALAWCTSFQSTIRGRNIDSNRFQRNALASGLIARELGRSLDLDAPAKLFLLGLTQGLGAAVLDDGPGTDYGEVIRKVRDGADIRQAEQNTLGTDRDAAWLSTARSAGLSRQLIAGREGWIRGTVTLRAVRFLNVVERLADLAGCGLFRESTRAWASRTGDLGLISLMDETVVLQVSRGLEAELPPYFSVLELPPYDPERINRNLIKLNRDLSLANAGNEKAHDALAYKVHDLETLAQVFTGIIKSLEGDPLTFSVLESLIEGFGLDGAFMLNRTRSARFAGYAARSDRRGEPRIDYIEMEEEDFPPALAACLNTQKPFAVKEAASDLALRELLGNVSQGWVAPSCVKGDVISIIGLGVGEDKNHRFGPDFAGILDILTAEIGLSFENTRLYRQLRKEADTDPLTGIANRRYIVQVLKAEFARFRRKGIPLSVSIFDMDHFKSINDVRGHLAGDELLVAVAEVLKDSIRESDYAGRYGGDEFIVVFPYTDIEESGQVMERIRARLRRLCMASQGPDLPHSLSVSMGMACADAGMRRFDEVINAADAALYAAKEQGRDRLVIG